MSWISDSSSPMRSMRVSAKGELVLAGESFDQGSVTDTNSKYETLEKVRTTLLSDRLRHVSLLEVSSSPLTRLYVLPCCAVGS